MAADPLREEQVRCHVVVDQALTQDPDAAAGRKRDGGDEHGADDHDDRPHSERPGRRSRSAEDHEAADQRQPDGDRRRDACPGSLTAMPQITSSAEIPVAGPAAECLGRPAIAMIAEPSSSEAPTISAPASRAESIAEA